MAVDEIRDLKGWLNAWDGKVKKKKKLNVDVRQLTLEEGWWLVAEWGVVDQAKAEKNKAVAAKKVLKAAERQQLCNECVPDKPFIGSLSTKSKPDLLDIISVLKLSDKGSRSNLIGHLTEHFEENTPQKSAEVHWSCQSYSRMQMSCTYQ